MILGANGTSALHLPARSLNGLSGHCLPPGAAASARPYVPGASNPPQSPLRAAYWPALLRLRGIDRLLNLFSGAPAFAGIRTRITRRLQRAIFNGDCRGSNGDDGTRCSEDGTRGGGAPAEEVVGVAGVEEGVAAAQAGGSCGLRRCTAPAPYRAPRKEPAWQ
jgi:hypothetical protein